MLLKTDRSHTQLLHYNFPRAVVTGNSVLMHMAVDFSMAEDIGDAHHHHHHQHQGQMLSGANPTTFKFTTTTLAWLAL
jgi:hypothetical protein